MARRGTRDTSAAQRRSHSHVTLASVGKFRFRRCAISMRTWYVCMYIRAHATSIYLYVYTQDALIPAPRVYTKDRTSLWAICSVRDLANTTITITTTTIHRTRSRCVPS